VTTTIPVVFLSGGDCFRSFGWKVLQTGPHDACVLSVSGSRTRPISPPISQRLRLRRGTARHDGNTPRRAARRRRCDL
jgi:hypothetical protein